MLELDEQLAASELDLEALAAVAEALNERPEQLRDELQQATRARSRRKASCSDSMVGSRPLKPCSRRRWSRAGVAEWLREEGWNSAHARRMGYGSSRAGSWRWKPCWEQIYKRCCWTISPRSSLQASNRAH